MAPLLAPPPGRCREKTSDLFPPSVPNDKHGLAEEMADLFDEDKVTHQHGRTELERD